jgi:hypothetical protein
MSTQSPNHSLAEFGGGLDVEDSRTIVPQSKLRGDYDAARVHEVADEADSVTEAADLLRTKFEDAKHDLAIVDRYDEFASAQDLVQKLRQADDETETDEHYAQYKRGGRDE